MDKNLNTIRKFPRPTTYTSIENNIITTILLRSLIMYILQQSINYYRIQHQHSTSPFNNFHDMWSFSNWKVVQHADFGNDSNGLENKA